jgi:signal transduction histidine kinase
VPPERLPGAVEATAYFVVAEALTNAAKHARCEHAEVVARIEDGAVIVEVRDDGVGGADASSGSGLRGLADRVGAIGGELDVESPVGHGTVVRARIALAAPTAGVRRPSASAA